MKILRLVLLFIFVNEFLCGWNPDNYPNPMMNSTACGRKGS